MSLLTEPRITTSSSEFCGDIPEHSGAIQSRVPLIPLTVNVPWSLVCLLRLKSAIFIITGSVREIQMLSGLMSWWTNFIEDVIKSASDLVQGVCICWHWPFVFPIYEMLECSGAQLQHNVPVAQQFSCFLILRITIRLVPEIDVLFCRYHFWQHFDGLD